MALLLDKVTNAEQFISSKFKVEGLTYGGAKHV